MPGATQLGDALAHAQLDPVRLVEVGEDLADLGALLVERLATDHRPYNAQQERGTLLVVTAASQSMVERRLAIAADPGGFNAGEVAGCDDPVRRYFEASIAAGTPLARAARLRMRGAIKLGRIWVPFRAEELLAPLHGYSWPATVAGGLLRGSDTYADGEASMTWKLLGLVRVIRASGVDVARSATGRAAAEGVWLPTALLPRYGVRWRAADDHHLSADLPIGDATVQLELTIDDGGLVTALHIERWGPADGGFGCLPFGIEAKASHTFPCGITMPAEGTGGWSHGTEQWGDGQFMRYAIDDLSLVRSPGA